jgi:hypothetical protein
MDASHGVEHLRRRQKGNARQKGANPALGGLLRGLAIGTFGLPWKWGFLSHLKNRQLKQR